jgi:hypothetical protein
MLKKNELLLVLVAMTLSADIFCMRNYSVESPNAKISVRFWLTSLGEPVYTVSHTGSIILKESKLGIVGSRGDFSSNMTLDSVSSVNVVSDTYTLLHGKRFNCTSWVIGASFF